MDKDKRIKELEEALRELIEAERNRKFDEDALYNAQNKAAKALNGCGESCDD